MPFIYSRTVRFQDTDAAGVVYFANLLAICHEAYEESLAAIEVDVKAVFNSRAEIALPLSHASADFWRPVFCGDRLKVHLSPHQTQPSEFEITYQIFLDTALEKPVCTALTQHVCIATSTRQRQELPVFLLSWLEQWKEIRGQRVEGRGKK